MWTFSPSLVVIVGTIISASLIWNRIWYGKISQSEQKSHHPVYLMGRGIGRTLYAFVGLLLFDSVIRICFSNLVSFGHFKYALSSVILGIAFGIYLLIGTVFMAPTWKTLVTFITMVGTMGYLGILSITSENVDYTDLILISLAVGLIMGIIVNIGGFLYRSKRQDGTPKKDLALIFTTVSPPLWNASKKLSSLFTLKAHFIIFMIFFLELLLLFEGLTMFVWI